MAGLHDPRAHEQRHVNTGRFVPQKASHTSRRPSGVVGRGRITDEEGSGLAGSMEAAFASELLDLREGGALV